MLFERRPIPRHRRRNTGFQPFRQGHNVIATGSEYSHASRQGLTKADFAIHSLFGQSLYGVSVCLSIGGA